MSSKAQPDIFCIVVNPRRTQGRRRAQLADKHASRPDVSGRAGVSEYAIAETGYDRVWNASSEEERKSRMYSCCWVSTAVDGNAKVVEDEATGIQMERQRFDARLSIGEFFTLHCSAIQQVHAFHKRGI